MAPSQRRHTFKDGTWTWRMVFSFEEVLHLVSVNNILIWLIHFYISHFTGWSSYITYHLYADSHIFVIPMMYRNEFNVPSQSQRGWWDWWDWFQVLGCETFHEGFVFHYMLCQTQCLSGPPGGLHLGSNDRSFLSWAAVTLTANCNNNPTSSLSNHHHTENCKDVWNLSLLLSYLGAYCPVDNLRSSYWQPKVTIFH